MPFANAKGLFINLHGQILGIMIKQNSYILVYLNYQEGYMDNYDVYQSIAERTNGDIYVGVVGPVRTGKSTFIAKFMQNLVLPNIDNKFKLDRAIDEMPQAADGRTIMTTQPRFVPSDAVKVKLDNNVEMNVRMVDCVGYIVDGAIGHEENYKPRLVKTPWSENDLPFAEAAEIGTRKVISEHSTIGILMTTDGKSFSLHGVFTSLGL